MDRQGRKEKKELENIHELLRVKNIKRRKGPLLICKKKLSTTSLRRYGQWETTTLRTWPPLTI